MKINYMTIQLRSMVKGQTKLTIKPSRIEASNVHYKTI